MTLLIAFFGFAGIIFLLLCITDELAKIRHAINARVYSELGVEDGAEGDDAPDNDAEEPGNG